MAKTNSLKKFLIGMALLATPLVSMTGCSSFFGDDGYIITNVTTSYNEEGEYTTVTLTFSDEEVPPVSFKIPDGEEGNGIVDITARTDGDNVILTIFFSDEDKEPLQITVPVVHGRGIETLDITTNEEGNTVMVVKYTDGTQSDPITIINGKDGNGIANVNVDTDVNLNVIVTITFTDPNMEPVTFTVTRAASITGIEFDEKKSDKNTYYFIIKYSDGSVSSFSMPAPKDGEDGEDGERGEDGSTWYCAAVLPKETDGNIGDFWIYLITGDVYRKENATTWTRMFQFNLGTGSSSEVEVYADIIFNAGEGATFNDARGYRSVVIGKTLSLANFPENPTKDGYTFLGWYTHIDNVNAGKFTDLTVVTQNMTVYARWSENI